MYTFESNKGYSSPDDKISVKATLSKLVPIIGNVGWFISGSFASHKFRNKHCNDIDVFFTSRKEFEKASRGMTKYHGARKSAYDTAAAETYTVKGIDKPIQLISMHFGTPYEIFERFDLNVCRNAITPTGVLVKGRGADDILRIDKVGYGSFTRFLKYAHRMYEPITVLQLLRGVVKDYAGDDRLVTEIYNKTKIIEPLNKILYRTLEQEFTASGDQYIMDQFIKQSPELLI